jgi:hypothetical protein
VTGSCEHSNQSSGFKQNGRIPDQHSNIQHPTVDPALCSQNRTRSSGRNLRYLFSFKIFSLHDETTKNYKQFSEVRVFIIAFVPILTGARGSIVIKALCCKLEGCGFNTR